MSDGDEREQVDWSVVHEKLQLLDDQSNEVFSAFMVAEEQPDEMTSDVNSWFDVQRQLAALAPAEEDMREEIVLAFSNNLEDAAHIGVVDSAALHFIRSSCSIMMDPGYI